jgi:hypothetical protein
MGQNISAPNHSFQTIMPDDAAANANNNNYGNNGGSNSKKRRKNRLSFRYFFRGDKRMKTSAVKPAPSAANADCARSLPDFDLAGPRGGHHGGGEGKALSAKSCPAGFTPFKISPAAAAAEEASMHIDDAQGPDTPTALTLDFRMTEGQERRGLLADSEFECSQITDFLYVGGASVATSWDTIFSNGITRIVNCSSAVVENCFMDRENMKYLSLNMVDGRQDDISWFVCLVIQFVEAGRLAGEKTLIHCEKGVSRSCSFVIAHRIWSSGCSWKEAFEFVKQRRKVCAPNTAFTCNLMEFAEAVHGAQKDRNILFRCSYHLHHDISTAVLKACRDSHTRRLIEPTVSMLDSQGIFVLRPDPAICPNTVYVWQGANASSEVMGTVMTQVESMRGVYTNADRCDVEIIMEGFETPQFLSLFKQRQSLASINKEVIFEDLWTVDHEANIESLQLLNNEGFTADIKIGAAVVMDSNIANSHNNNQNNNGGANSHDNSRSIHLDEDEDDRVDNIRVVENSKAARVGSARRFTNNNDMVVEDDDMFFTSEANNNLTSTRAKLAKSNIIPALSLSMNMNALKLQSDNEPNSGNSNNSSININASNFGQGYDSGRRSNNSNSGRRDDNTSSGMPSPGMFVFSPNNNASNNANANITMNSNPAPFNFSLNLNLGGINNNNNNASIFSSNNTGSNSAKPFGNGKVPALSLNNNGNATNASLLSSYDNSETVRRVEAINVNNVSRPANPALMLNMSLLNRVDNNNIAGSGQNSNVNTNSQRFNNISGTGSYLSGNLSDKSLSVELSTNRSMQPSSSARHLDHVGSAANLPGTGMHKSDSNTSITSNSDRRNPLSVGLARGPLPISELMHAAPVHNGPGLGSSGSNSSLRLSLNLNVHTSSHGSLHGGVNVHTGSMAAPLAPMSSGRGGGVGGGGGGGGNSSERVEVSDAMEISMEADNGTGLTSKPLLFVATAKDPDGNPRSAADFEWDALGVYDDQDLHEVISAC